MSQENLFDQETTFSPANENTGIRAKIIGVGGAGVSLVDGLRFDDFQGVEHLAVDVDSRALADSIASEKLAFGRRHTRGMGTGGEYLLARKAAEEEKDVIRKHLEGVDLVLLGRLGRRNRRWAVPVIARLARDAGALVFAFAPLPFSWEKGRHAQAEECLAELRKHANAVVPLPNDSLLQVGGPDATALECFAEAGRNVGKGISAICSLVFRRGMIDVDYAHLRKAFNRRSGRTLFRIRGEGEGPDGIRHALRELMVCPMLHLPDVSKAADALLILITGGTGMGMAALQQASTEICSEFKAGEHVVFGAHVDENMGDRVQITVLGATDLEAGLPAADAAPFPNKSSPLPPKPNGRINPNLPRKSQTGTRPRKRQKKEKRPGTLDQNTFEFMEDGNQRGIFDDLPSRQPVRRGRPRRPAYLRRGVKIAV